MQQSEPLVGAIKATPHVIRPLCLGQISLVKPEVVPKTCMLEQFSDGSMTKMTHTSKTSRLVNLGSTNHRHGKMSPLFLQLMIRDIICEHQQQIINIMESQHLATDHHHLRSVPSNRSMLSQVSLIQTNHLKPCMIKTACYCHWRFRLKN